MRDDLQGAIERLQKYRAQNAKWPQHCINVGLYLHHIDALLTAVLDASQSPNCLTIAVPADPEAAVDSETE